MVHHTTGASASPVRASVNRPPAKPRAQDQDERNSGKETQTPKGSCKGPTDEEDSRVKDRTTKGSSCPPFCSAGLRPVAPPRSLLHLPSRRLQKALEGGRAPTSTASRRPSSNRERAAPPLLTKRVGIQAEAPGGEIQAGDSGGRLRRENVVKVALWCGWRGC